MSLIQYAGVVLGYVNMVILFPKYLDLDEFGLVRILLTVAIVISQIAQFGTPSMVIRYFPRMNRRVLTLGIWICTLGLMVVLAILFLFQSQVANYYIDKSALFVDYIYLLIPFSIAMVFYNLFDAYLKALYKNVLSASMPFIILRILWMGLILAYARDLISFSQFIILYSFSYTAIALITLMYIAWLRVLPRTLLLDREDRLQIPEIRSFNSFNILSGLSAFLITKIDILMLGGMKGLTAVGIYSIAVAMATVIRIPAASIARIAPSLIAEAFHRNDLSAIRSLYKKSAINQFILSASVFLLILINYDLLLYFLPEEYAASFFVFFFLGLSQVLDTGVGVNGYIMVNSKYFKVDAIFSILLLILSVVSNLVLIPLYDVLGAAIATVSSILVYNIIRLVFIQKRMHMQPFTGKNTLALILFTVSAGVAWFLPDSSVIWLTSLYKSGVFLLITIPGVYLLKLSPDLNELFDIGIRMLRK